LGSGELGNSQAVKHSNGQDSVQAQAAVMPPPARLARHSGCQFLAGTQFAQFAVDHRPAPPLLELYGAQSMPQPGVERAHDLGGLRQPEVRLPARHVGPQPCSNLLQAAPTDVPTDAPTDAATDAPRQRPQALAQPRQGPPGNCPFRFALVRRASSSPGTCAPRLQPPPSWTR